MTPNQENRFKIYLKYFTDGNVSLDYLKQIIIRDKVLKSDVNKSLELFPNFLILPGDYIEDIYDDAYMKIPNAEDMRIALASVVSYIENSIFSQDIATLNILSQRFEKAININDLSQKKLDSEITELNRIDKEFQAQVLETKKVYAAYDAVMSMSSSNVDPVSTVTREYEQKIQDELNRQSQIKAALAEDEKRKEEANANAQNVTNVVNETAQAVKEVLPDLLKDAAQTQQTYNEEFEQTVDQVRNEGGTIVQSSTAPKTETKADEKKSNLALPLIAGAGILAFTLFNKE